MRSIQSGPLPVKNGVISYFPYNWPYKAKNWVTRVLASKGFLVGYISISSVGYTYITYLKYVYIYILYLYLYIH